MFTFLFLMINGAKASVEVLAASSACFNAVTVQDVTFNAPVDGIIEGIRLVHTSGEVSCKASGGLSNWGCDSQYMGVQLMRTDDERILYPGADTQNVLYYGSCPVPCATDASSWWYFPEYSTTDSQLDEFSLTDPEYAVTTDQSFKLVWGEACCQSTIGDNSGESCADVYFIYAHAAGQWTRGGEGETCDEVCGALGKTCNADIQSTIKSCDAVTTAFAQAGYECLSCHDPRSYAGTPFSTERTADDCGYLVDGAESVCNANTHSNTHLLCYCESPIDCALSPRGFELDEYLNDCSTSFDLLSAEVTDIAAKIAAMASALNDESGSVTIGFVPDLSRYHNEIIVCLMVMNVAVVLFLCCRVDRRGKKYTPVGLYSSADDEEEACLNQKK